MKKKPTVVIIEYALGIRGRHSRDQCTKHLTVSWSASNSVGMAPEPRDPAELRLTQKRWLQVDAYTHLQPVEVTSLSD